MVSTHTSDKTDPYSIPPGDLERLPAILTTVVGLKTFLECGSESDRKRKTDPAQNTAEYYQSGGDLKDEL